MAILSVNEQIILVAILRMKEDAYGFEILKKVIEITGKKIVYGTLYNSLDNLVKKNYINIYKGEPTSARGGKRKVYYKITPLGRRKIFEAKEFHESILSGISDLILDKELDYEKK